MKRIIVVGHKGQDGTLLVDDLKSKGNIVFGIAKSTCLQPDNLIELRNVDITNYHDVKYAVKTFKPDEIYYLAAYHTSSEASKNGDSLIIEYEAAQAININGLVNFLINIVEEASACKLFYASSSLVFSGENGIQQDESTTMTPQGFYGITKAQGMYLCKEFRNKYDVFVSTGILYNHESHLRNIKYLSSKIIRKAIDFSKGMDGKLEIGCLDSRIDWGYAKDFVKIFQMILSHNIADDYIVATGESHTVREFIDIVFSYFHLDPSEYIIENNGILNRTISTKHGNIEKIKSIGWKPYMGFQEFVIQLINDHIRFFSVKVD